MVGNVTLGSDGRQINSELLAWLNDTLQCTFNRVEETCSGAAYCQLFDLINPGCINLQKVKFNAKDEMDVLKNYMILEGAFFKTSIKKSLSIGKLVSGNLAETLNLLSWFKVYSTRCKFVGRHYDPVAARNGQILEPFVSKKPGARTPQNSYPEKVKVNADSKAGIETEDFFCSRTTLCFIQKYWPSVSTSAGSDVAYSRAEQVLGQNYPKDISGSCNQAPYCLYVYHGAELSDGEKAVVVLIGYFDQMAELIKVGLLDVIQETDSDLLNSIMKTLKKFRIPLANMAAFYSNAPNLAEVIAGLRAQNSCTVFLCSLTGIAEQACRSGVTAMELSESIRGLIKEVQQHFPYLPAYLKEQLSHMKELNVTTSLTCDCLLLRKTVQKIVVLWPDLVRYFTRQGGSSNKMRIRFLLNDEALRLSFLFLCHALQPLCDFQESLNQDKDVKEVLQDACGVVHAYVSSFVTPKAVERFFRRGNASPKKDTLEHLPREEVNVGEQVNEYIGQKDAGLADSLDHFYKNVFSFYTAVTSSILRSLPVSETTARNISVVLSPERNLEVTAAVVTELAVQFGVCSSSEDTSLLIDEYLEYLMAERESPLTSQSNQSLDQFWIAELRLMDRASLFRKMILRLLVLPKELRMDKVFAQLFESAGVDCLNDGIVVKIMDVSELKDEVVTDSSMHKSAPLDPLSSGMRVCSLSDVIDLTEEEDAIPMETNTSAFVPGTEVRKEKTVNSSESILIDDDEDDDDVIWTNSYSLENSNKRRATHKSAQKGMNNSYKDGKAFTEGEMVWGQMSGSVRYPGLVQKWVGEKPSVLMRRVVWFGSGLISKVRTESLRPFSAFTHWFSRNSFDTVPKYKEAIFHSLQVASVRSEKVFSLKSDSKEDLLEQMLDWAIRGFKDTGPDGLKPRSREDECLKIFDWESLKWTKMNIRETEIDLKKLEKSFCLKEVSVCLKKLSDSLDLQNGWLHLKDEDEIRKLRYPVEKLAEKKLSLPDKQPVSRKKSASKNKCQNRGSSSIVDEDQANSRHQMAHEVLVNKKNIEDFCLSCGSGHTVIFHPLFEGSLCLKCKNNFTETLYRYDEDGYQSYCTVCCAGLKVVLCGNESCCRSFCFDCVDILVGKGTFDQLKDLEPWICYLCAPDSSSGVLKPRHDWSIRVQEFFANNSAMEFEPHRVYPSIPANQRRPIRVLSLFDGIGTGYLVLKELGIKVEAYVASEVDDDSITVSMVNHDGKITHVEDVRTITQKHIEKWGPFDLLIGGSPCNDLSIVNPARKGLFEGTGRLFFDYYRLLNRIKPKEDDPRPFFWLFENVVFMNSRDKADICRFLECNPVLVDALHVSPAHRARYFWGNLPGMNRPIVASQNDKLSLQECLDTGRTAKFDKVRTITTNPNSLKQGTNVQHFPVSMNGKDDGLWITELEKIFGFPKHYTDVKNMGRNQRQKVLGKSWSVPVIRHLFAPLKDYFACDKSH